ncbi:hypothetical protein GZ77_17265 [Endozoicomonas montiporae]|uniref:DUF5666 domain-containing protein n=2 Tax=Endozoicomonas montiporae TaxID=1027273 RepID=A0A081N1I8_9GAMM|nr:hypothetical protein [Endozoicomonas montiporae]AMO58760.1 hypothetical protein EZMO1_4869 [Endozoicomonas montiporae CL-33]KEQ12311.1 hypothetical protein GZ77_17265 [Endozoicomonas montiporae]
MKLFKALSAGLAICLMSGPAIARPTPAPACSIPDGVYELNGSLPSASNYTVLIFIQNASTRMLFKDKIGNNDYIVAPKGRVHGKKGMRRGHGKGKKGHHRKHRHGRPVLCQGHQIKVNFGPQSRKAMVSPAQLSGSIELTHTNSQLSGSVTLNGNLNGVNAIQLNRQNR